jgi:two-component system NarL family response regulator
VAEPAKIRLLLVDDHPVVRLGLKAALEAEPDMVVVAEASNGDEALRAFDTHRPDVTLMDLRMPGLSGPEAIRALRARSPAVKVIVLTSYDGDEDVYRAIEAGAQGYLLKQVFREGLLEAVRAVHAGQRYLPTNVAARLAQRVTTPALTAREREVLSLVGKGLTNKEIAGALAFAEDTVKNYLKRIFTKLEVTDRTEAVMAAVARGLIERD